MDAARSCFNPHLSGHCMEYAYTRSTTVERVTPTG